MFVKLNKMNPQTGIMVEVRVKYDSIDFFYGTHEIVGTGTPPTYMDLTAVVVNDRMMLVLETPDEVEQFIRREILKYEEQ
jgi:hypothetical protein